MQNVEATDASMADQGSEHVQAEARRFFDKKKSM